MDYPSKTPNKRMAVLDLEVWTQEEEGRMVVVYSFYKKEVALPYTILKRSAQSYPVKKCAILQETLIRQGNCSRSVFSDKVAEHMSKYYNMLRLSGCFTKERYYVVKGAKYCHSEMQEEVKSGIRMSMYRTRDEILEAKDLKGGICSSTWLLEGEVESVITCQVTPGEILAYRI